MPATKTPLEKSCLNGWWDILPCYEPVTKADVPQLGWLEGQYLVPSFWTKPMSAVRRAGETHYTSQENSAVFDAHGSEFLFDAFGYPSAWSKTRSAWLRRTLSVETLDPTLRQYLVFEALIPKATLFVNGHVVGTHVQPTLPLEADVTPWLRAGALFGSIGTCAAAYFAVLFALGFRLRDFKRRAAA